MHAMVYFVRNVDKKKKPRRRKEGTKKNRARISHADVTERSLSFCCVFPLFFLCYIFRSFFISLHSIPCQHNRFTISKNSLWRFNNNNNNNSETKNANKIYKWHFFFSIKMVVRKKKRIVLLVEGKFSYILSLRVCVQFLIAQNFCGFCQLSYYYFIFYMMMERTAEIVLLAIGYETLYHPILCLASLRFYAFFTIFNAIIRNGLSTHLSILRNRITFVGGHQKN